MPPHCLSSPTIARNFWLPRHLQRLLFGSGPLYHTSVGLATTSRAPCSNPIQEVRVRFAPSPTGYLHVGGLRSALVNYLFAVRNGGKFILRIEDTDRTRLVPDSVANITEMLTWAGIKIHEGPRSSGSYGPYIQSERLAFYKNGASRLLDDGSAYKCFCSEERLSTLRGGSRHNDAHAIKHGYDNRCRNLTQSEIANFESSKTPFTIRLKMLDHSVTAVHDLIYGTYKHDVFELEADPIILKSDGFPTYHLANVVDDWEMKISHVIRGEEWMTSTVKHLLLYKALGYKPPVFAHIPNLMNETGQKISKRGKDNKSEYFFVQRLKEEGVEPSVLVNYLAKLGQKSKNPEIQTIDELAKDFRFEDISHHRYKVIISDIFALNTIFLDGLDTKDAATILRSRLPSSGVETDLFSDDFLEKVIQMLRRDKRLDSLNRCFAPEYQFIWKRPCFKNQSFKIDDNLVSKLCDVNFDQISAIFLVPKDFKSPSKEIAARMGVKPRHFIRILRLALTGQESGPALTDVISLLGADECCVRFELFLKSQGEPRLMKEGGKGKVTANVGG